MLKVKDYPLALVLGLLTLVACDGNDNAAAVPPQPLNLTVSITGTGVVTSDPVGISCGATCRATYPSGAAMTLNAVPAPGYAFSGWSGACADTNPICNITMSEALAVTAIFSASDSVLFQDGFESGDLTHTQNNIRWAQEGVRTSISTTPAPVREGARSFEFSFEAAVDDKDSFSEHRILLTPKYTDLWIMYDLYVPVNYHHRTQRDSDNNKFFAIFRNPYTSPGFQVNFSTTPNGSGGSNIDVRYMNNGAEQGSLTPTSGQNFITSTDAGRWHTIIMHFKVPTGQNTNDGIMQLWKNGSEIINITNLASWGGSGANYFDQAYVLGWSNSGYTEQTNFYVDNFVISSKPLR